MVDAPAKLAVEGLAIRYGDSVVLSHVDLVVREHEIFGIIGPAQSGKTTLLKVLNRTIDLVTDASVKGSFSMDDRLILDAPVTTQAGKLSNTGVSDVYGYRRYIGMVAPLPVGLPMSIYDNVAFAPRQAGMKKKEALEKTSAKVNSDFGAIFKMLLAGADAMLKPVDGGRIDVHNFSAAVLERRNLRGGVFDTWLYNAMVFQVTD